MATKYDLAKRIAQKTGIGIDKVNEVLDVLGEAIAEVLREDFGEEKRLSIPGLVSLTLKKDNRTKIGYRLVFKEARVFALHLEKAENIKVA